MGPSIRGKDLLGDSPWALCLGLLSHFLKIRLLEVLRPHSIFKEKDFTQEVVMTPSMKKALTFPPFLISSWIYTYIC